MKKRAFPMVPVYALNRSQRQRKLRDTLRRYMRIPIRLCPFSKWPKLGGRSASPCEMTMSHYPWIPTIFPCSDPETLHERFAILSRGRRPTLPGRHLRAHSTRFGQGATASPSQGNIAQKQKRLRNRGTVRRGATQNSFRRRPRADNLPWVDSTSRLGSLSEEAHQAMLLHFFRFLARVDLNPAVFGEHRPS